MTTRYFGDFLLPALDPHTTAWFTGGTLNVQFCNVCDAAQHPPEDVCRRCQGSDLGFRALRGDGTVESAVVVHHPVHPGLADRVPYVVAVISIDGAPGCNAIGNVVNRSPEEVAIGQRVRAVFENARDASGRNLTIPQWEVVEG